MGGVLYGKGLQYDTGDSLAGAIVGMHVYMCLDSKSRHNVKEEVADAIDDIKRAAEKLMA